MDCALRIRSHRYVWLRPTTPIAYHLIVRELISIELTGSGNADGPMLVLEGKETSIRVSGSGDVKMNGHPCTGRCEHQGGRMGNLRGNGDNPSTVSVYGDRMHVAVTGSGDVDLGELVCDQLRVRLTRSGDLAAAGDCTESRAIPTSGSVVYQACDLFSVTDEVRVSGSAKRPFASRMK